MRRRTFLIGSATAMLLAVREGVVAAADPKRILYPIRDRATWVFVDRNGNVIKPEVECFNLDQFSEGLIAFVEHRKKVGQLPHGYMDAAGKVVFKSTEWHKPGPFREGLAAVAVVSDGRWGYINTKGEWAIPPPKEPRFSLFAMPFSDGLAAVNVRGRNDLGHTAFIDRSGKVVTPEPLGRVSSFSEGFAAVLKEMWGFIDKQGRWVVAPQYHWCGDFREGLAPVGDLAQDWYLSAEQIRASATTTRSTTGPSATSRPVAAAFALPAGWSGYSFFEGLALVCDDHGKHGYIDRSGKVVIEPQFSAALRFSNGLAAVRGGSGEEWGFIDRTGRVVIEPIYRSKGTSPTHAGGNRWDRRHNRSLDAANPFPFTGGATVVLAPRGGDALIDTNGTVIFEER